MLLLTASSSQPATFILPCTTKQTAQANHTQNKQITEHKKLIVKQNHEAGITPGIGHATWPSCSAF